MNEAVEFGFADDIRWHQVNKVAEGAYPNAVFGQQLLQQAHIDGTRHFNHANRTQDAHLCAVDDFFGGKQGLQLLFDAADVALPSLA